MLLKTLTGLNGVSGNENEVRNFIKSYITGYADDILVDRAGNLIAYKKGLESSKRVMLSAHMDEVGFIIGGVTDDGMIKFYDVGGFDDRILPGKTVVVGEKKLPGVIGVKPVHIQRRAERSKNIDRKELYIDIGATKKDEALKHVKIGDYISFPENFEILGNRCIKSKALDNRAGCAILTEVLKNRYKYDLYACFTVQEEVGLRGAEVAAYRVKPDVAIVLEATTCSDVPGIEKHNYTTELGKGPAVSFMDRSTFYDRKLVGLIFDTASRNGVKVQYKKAAAGGNDAGKIHISGGGVRTAAISVPTRYIHAPSSLMSIDDFESTQRLVELVLRELENNGNLFER